MRPFAQLQKANLGDAQLQDAIFAGADLEGAEFQRDALGLTPEQFDLALNVDKALLPTNPFESRRT